MTEKQSIFQKLLFRNLRITLITLLGVMGAVCCLACAWCRYNEKNSVLKALNQYVTQIETEKTIAMKKYDYIINNRELLRLLDYSDDDVSDLFAVSTSVNTFVDIINNSDKSTVSIFSANDLLYEGTYIHHMEACPNYRDIIQKFKGSSMYFEDELRYDKNEQPYFSLYCKAFLENETIICIKAYLPENSSEELLFSITQEGSATHPQAVSIPLSRSYSVSACLRTDRLRMQYLLCFCVFLLVAAVFSVTVILLAVKINKQTTSRIIDFISQLADNEYLNENAQIIFQADDNDDIELKTLKEVLWALTDKIKQAVSEKNKSDLEKKILMSDMLQSKINPHLLYNSLSVLSHHAFKSNDRITVDIIRELVEYYRLVLAKGKEITTVSEELALIKKFIHINEVADMETYNLTVEMEPELAECKIVHLILQPFVENSIVHGLTGIKRTAQIKISIQSKGDFIEIVIYDNGYGMPEETLRPLQDFSLSEGKYGIRNTCERIRLYYNEKAAVRFESREGEWTRVIILLPKRWGEETPSGVDEVES